MKVPPDRRYAETHEWFLLDDTIVTMGITQYAADELTDITFVELPEVGSRVTVGDVIGEVTSGTLSPTLDKSIAMAFVAADSASDGTALEVEVSGKRVPAKVVKLPFYKRPR